MTFTGELVIDTPNGQRTIKADDFQQETFTNDNNIQLEWEDEDISVDKIFGGEPGEGHGDWETKNCTIVRDTIEVHFY